MIKFFRRFRRKLFKGNKTFKYLLLSVGEIILVVIGIVMALQINNGNEGGRQSDFEEQILLSFGEDLAKDLADANYNLK